METQEQKLDPKYIYMEWYGGTLPHGWTVCDGSNRTEDFRGMVLNKIDLPLQGGDYPTFMVTRILRKKRR